MIVKCAADGVPTPTLAWYKPNGNELKRVIAKESTVEVTINDEHKFGEYNCVAYNGLDPPNKASIFLEQIGMFYLFIYLSVCLSI